MACRFLNVRVGLSLIRKSMNLMKDDVRLSCTLCGENLTYVRLRNLQRTPSKINKLLSKRLIPNAVRRELSLDSTDAVKVTLAEMKFFLNSSGLPFEEGHACLKLNCPICQHSLGTMQRHKWGTMYINTTTGMFICYSCKQTGSWQLFQDYIAVLQKKNGKAKSQTLPFRKHESNIFLSEEQLASVQKEFDSFISLHDLNKTEFQQLLKKFKMKHLQPETLSKFNVRMSSDGTELFFPLHDPVGTLVGFHSLQVNSSKDGSEDIVERFTPRNPVLAAFGWIGRMSQPDVVLTTSPLDVMTVKQETNKQALSLPRGISALPLEVLPMFEKFSKVTIWFGNTLHDWEAAKTFSLKLGRRRCFFVRPREDQPSPFTALQERLNCVKVLKESQAVTHKSITTFNTLRQEVLAEMSHVDQVAGIKWMRFPGLNQLLKGHRRGELTVFTGPTGTGKTTFMSEYSLDLCIQGVNTLWGSFEIPNIRLAGTMLKQFSLLPLEKNLEQFDFWADKFEQIPLYFMTFHGQQSIKHVLDAMAHAVYVHDIQHVVVDNVQFMMGTDSSRAGLDRFYRQDLLVAAFRKFSTRHNCHVTLVMHPRKERDGEELSTSSIFGGAKASQEADNVLILQERKLTMLRGKKYIQVVKNRFDGDLGSVPIQFDKETHTFSQKKAKKSPPTPKRGNESLESL